MKIIALLFWLPWASNAADLGGRLRHPHVYRVENRARDHVIFGWLDEVGAEPARYAFLRVTDGRLVDRRVTRHSDRDQIGSIYFDLGDDLTLFIPLTHVHRGSRRGPARLVGPGAGREELSPVRATKALLAELGVLDLVDADTLHEPPAPAPAAAPAPRPSAGNNSAAVLHFGLAPAEAGRLGDFERDPVTGGPSHFTYTQEVRGRVMVRLWTARSRAHALAERVRETFDVTPRIRVRLLDDDDLAAADPDGSTPERVAHLARITAEDPRAAIDLGAVHRDVAAAELWLREIEDVIERLKTYSRSAIALGDLHADFETPLLDIVRAAFARIHARGDQEGLVDLLYAWPERYEYPLHYLHRDTGTKDGTYFESWLATLRWRLLWGERAVDVAFAAAERRPSLDFAVSRRTLALVEILPPRLHERFPRGIHFPFGPVLALGLEGSDVARREFQKLILVAATAAERVRLRSRGEKIAGNALLAEFLRAIALGMRNTGVKIGQTDFGVRHARYYQEAATLFADLLQDERAIRNDATYLVVLDAAFLLMGELEADFDKNPARTAGGSSVIRLTGALLRLKDALIEELRPDGARGTRCARALAG